MANEEDMPRGQDPDKPLSAADVDAVVARAREARRRRDPADLLSERLSGDYIFSHTFEDPGFTACDAIALGLLARKTTSRHESWLTEYYLSAFRSVVCALRLSDSEETLLLLTPETHPRDGQNTHPRFQRFQDPWAFRELLKVRHAALRFRDARGRYLEGDPWIEFQREVSVFDGMPNHQSLRTAAAWLESMCVQVTGGIRPIDEAICTLICWDTSLECSFARLRQDFGYPDPEPILAEWMDSQ